MRDLLVPSATLSLAVVLALVLLGGHLRFGLDACEHGEVRSSLAALRVTAPPVPAEEPDHRSPCVLP